MPSDVASLWTAPLVTRRPDSRVSVVLMAFCPPGPRGHGGSDPIPSVTKQGSVRPLQYRVTVKPAAWEVVSV